VHENNIPPKLDTKYNELNFQLPSPFSRPDPIITVETKFKHKCTKLACKNVGVINLQTYPLFFIFLASFHPNISKALGLGAKNSVLTILYIQREMKNMEISIITIRTVNVQHLNVGHKLIYKA
jgi:hypothetical protein